MKLIKYAGMFALPAFLMVAGAFLMMDGPKFR